MSTRQNELGEVSLSEMRTLEVYHNRTEHVLAEIGRVEIHKAELLAQHAALKAGAEALLQSIAARLSIPSGIAYEVTRDGKVCVQEVVSDNGLADTP